MDDECCMMTKIHPEFVWWGNKKWELMSTFDHVLFEFCNNATSLQIKQTSQISLKNYDDSV
jgi:hypothetical protein